MISGRSPAIAMEPSFQLGGVSQTVFRRATVESWIAEPHRVTSDPFPHTSTQTSMSDSAPRQGITPVPTYRISADKHDQPRFFEDNTSLLWPPAVQESQQGCGSFRFTAGGCSNLTSKAASYHWSQVHAWKVDAGGRGRHLSNDQSDDRPGHWAVLPAVARTDDRPDREVIPIFEKTRCRW